MNNDEMKPPAVENQPTPDIESIPQPTFTTEVDEKNIRKADTSIATEPVANKPAANTPGVIILQWLSYAFWGWLILAIIWLLGVILADAILGTSDTGMIPYAIAAGIVLLPIAFLTDFFYRKHEPTKKTGVAMVIMVIHAVLFALLAIAALIVMVFNSLNALIETSNSIDEQLVTIFTAIGATILYTAAFIRTLNPFKSKKPVFAYSVAMVATTSLLIVFAIVGPLVQTLATKDDRRIEQNLSSVNQSINSYIQSNEKLPASLNEVTYSNDEATLLVEDGLVRYGAEKSIASEYNKNRIEHRYQLCVTFKEKDASKYSSRDYSSANNDYSSYVSVYGHAKGEVCYKLSETITQSTNSLNTIKGVEIEETIFN
jgi:hypothetical protein